MNQICLPHNIMTKNTELRDTIRAINAGLHDGGQLTPRPDGAIRRVPRLAPDSSPGRSRRRETAVAILISRNRCTRCAGYEAGHVGLVDGGVAIGVETSTIARKGAGPDAACVAQLHEGKITHVDVTIAVGVKPRRRCTASYT